MKSQEEKSHSFFETCRLVQGLFHLDQDDVEEEEGNYDSATDEKRKTDRGPSEEL